MIYNIIHYSKTTLKLYLLRMGVIFKGEIKNMRNVNYMGTQLTYETIHTLVFDSTHKRMSVLVRCMQTRRYI